MKTWKQKKEGRKKKTRARLKGRALLWTGKDDRTVNKCCMITQQ